MQFRFETPVGKADAALIEKAKATVLAAQSPLELVFGWLSDERRSISICPGLPEPQDEGDITLFLLRIDRQEVGQAVVLESEIKDFFPDLRLVSDALLPEARADVIDAADQGRFMEDGGCNDRWFEELDKRLKPVWHDGLCHSIIKREASIYLALCYALARNGEASFEMVRSDDKAGMYYDVDFSQFPAGLFSFDACYNHEKNGLGFGVGYLVV